jgi:hypothetical protein
MSLILDNQITNQHNLNIHETVNQSKKVTKPKNENYSSSPLKEAYSKRIFAIISNLS